MGASYGQTDRQVQMATFWWTAACRWWFNISDIL